MKTRFYIPDSEFEFEEIQEFDYLSSGEVKEQRNIRNGEVVFRMVLEYISLELPGIP